MTTSACAEPYVAAATTVGDKRQERHRADQRQQS